MVSGSLFKEMLVVKGTLAVACQVNTSLKFTATLEKGQRFSTVASVCDQDEFTFFLDVETGMYWMAPADCLFELSGRFGGGDDTELN